MAQHLKIRLPAVRVNAGLSQEELANRMHVSRATIVNWENNKVKMSEAEMTLYSTICGFPKDYIFLPYQFSKCGLQRISSREGGSRCVCKKVKRNILAILITIIIVELTSYVGFWETEKFKYSCMYMLIYLCINEVLKVTCKYFAISIITSILGTLLPEHQLETVDLSYPRSLTKSFCVLSLSIK